VSSKSSCATAPASPEAGSLSSTAASSGSGPLSPAEQKLLEYDSVEKLAALFDSLAWSLDEEIALLIDTARCAPTATVRMKALKALREIRQEALKLAGTISEYTATRTTEDGRGNTVQESIVARLIKKGGDLHDAVSITSDPSLPETSDDHNSRGPQPSAPRRCIESHEAGTAQEEPKEETGPEAEAATEADDRPGAIPGLAVSSSA